MPKSTKPATSELDNFRPSAELSSSDLIRVWDREKGKWCWTTLDDLRTFILSTP